MNLQSKSLPLLKQEVMLLLNLIENHKIVISKGTNATNNHLKEEAWKNITKQFNSRVSSCPRRPGQLRLKWENLKKAARKRHAEIKMNCLQSGEHTGQFSYIPPNDALDRVAAILAATNESYSAESGGDTSSVMMSDSEDQTVGQNYDIKEEIVESDNHFTISCELATEGTYSDVGSIGDGNGNTAPKENMEPQSATKPNNSFCGSNRSKHKYLQYKETEILTRIKRNNSVAEYYSYKRKKLEDEEKSSVRIEKEKLKLEVEVLKMEKIKLELEIEMLKNRKLEM